MTIDPKAVAEMAAAYTVAWNSGSADAVAAFFAEDAEFIINRGELWKKRSGVAEMAAGFFHDVPDLVLNSDDVRCSDTHAVNIWTITGHHVDTGNPVSVRGWEEWELTADLKIKTSRGWYDAEDYARQIEGK